jgi:lipopolysaccharide transport system permease protein
MIRATRSSLWDYRAFIAGNIKRDFQTKYRRSLLGSAWAVLQPLAMILVYTVVFSVYLCSGISQNFEAPRI